MLVPAALGVHTAHMWRERVHTTLIPTAPT